MSTKSMVGKWINKGIQTGHNQIIIKIKTIIQFLICLPGVTWRRTLVDVTHRFVEPSASYASRLLLEPLALAGVTLLAVGDAILAVDVARAVDATRGEKRQVLAAAV